ncbi:MAG: antibiotic biosynthesis monooxygenase [Roseivirga sp.]
MDTHKYGLIGSLKAKEGKAEELGKILLKASDLVTNARSCISYVISLDAEDKNLLWITEVWDSKADHDASLQNPEVRALIGTAMPLLDGPPQKGKELKVLGGLGSDL